MNNEIGVSAVLRTVNGLVKKGIAVAMLAGLVACQAADGTNQAPDVALVDSIMRGLGAVDPNEQQIEYKPRAPLAMPAEPSQLPEPETEVAGTQSQDWPQQQESDQLRELKELYAAPGRSRDAPLSPEQMRGFKITGVTGQGNRDTVAERRDEEIVDGEQLTRAEITEQDQRLRELRSQQANINNGGLATRRYLTEPPTAYSTPSPDAPMPEVVTKKEKSRPSNYDKYNSAPIDPRCLEGDSSYCR